MIPIPPTRRCFTFGCTGIPEGTCWECPACKQRIHRASERATARAAEAKALASRTRCVTADTLLDPRSVYQPRSPVVASRRRALPAAAD